MKPDHKDRLPLTAAEISTFLGVTAAGVRQIIRRKGIQPAGKRGRAHLYWTHEVVKAAGAHDRQLTQNHPDRVLHYP